MEFLIVYIAALIHAASNGVLGADTSPFVVASTSDLESWKTFSSDDSSNYRTLTLDGDTLFIGARGRIFGRNATDITKQRYPAVIWPVTKVDSCTGLSQSQNGQKCINLVQMVQPLNQTHLLVCGTNFLDPKNKLMVKSGDRYHLAPDDMIQRPLCSFDPEDSVQSLTMPSSNGVPSIFSTERSGLQSKISIVKTLPHKSLLMYGDSMQAEVSNTVASFAAMDTAVSPQMSKIYFVSDENSDELKSSYAATVTQVCVNDMGGKNILTSSWTSLLKARLQCQTEDELLFELVTDAVLGRDRTLYGTFTTRHHSFRTNAVCSFRLSDIQKALNTGQYWEKNGETYSKVHAPDNSIRPGICAYPGMLPSKPAASTSMNFSTSHLTFMSKHNLVTDIVKPSYPPSSDGSIDPIHRGPLLTKSTQNRDKFTKIAVEQVTDLDGLTHDVLFVGTEQGNIYKFIAIEKKNTVESVELAQYTVSKSPIISMKLSKKYRTLFAGTETEVHQISTSNCGAYTKTCEYCDPCRMCVLSRDPNCAWDSIAESCVSISGKESSSLLQDVSDGDAVTQCGPMAAADEILKLVDEGATEILGQVVKNPIISCSWYKLKDATVKQKIMDKNGKYRISMDRQLEISNFDAKSDAAIYECEYLANSVVVSKQLYDIQSSEFIAPVVTISTTEKNPTNTIVKIPKTPEGNSSQTVVNPPTNTNQTPGGNVGEGSTDMIAITVAVLLIVIAILVVFFIVLFRKRTSLCRKKYKPDGPSAEKANAEDRDSSPEPIVRDNSTNNNNAQLLAVERLPSNREETPLLVNTVESTVARRESVDGERRMQGSKSCDFIDDIDFIDEPSDQKAFDHSKSVNLEQSSSLRVEVGRKRIPPSRTKSMPGSALYVVFGGKKLKCSTLQRNKKGTWVIELPNQSGMSAMGNTDGEEEIIDIVGDDEAPPHFESSTTNDATHSRLSDGSGHYFDSVSTGEKHSGSNVKAKNHQARKAFFDGDSKAVGDGNPTVNYITSTPNRTGPIGMPDLIDSAKEKSDIYKKPLVEQNSRASLRSYGQNSSEEVDSDSTVKGSSSTLKQEDTPVFKHVKHSTTPKANAPRKTPHYHHHSKPATTTEVPTYFATSDAILPKVESPPLPDFGGSFDRSSTGSSDGDEQLHGRDKNVSKNCRSKVPDSPSKVSHSSSSSAGSSKYESARSSVISDQNPDQR